MSAKSIYEPIGILGGTFDPIHLGHLHLANEVCKQAKLKKIILIPCAQSPTRSQPIANSKDRLIMLEKAIINLPNLIINDLEIQHGGSSYTIDTLKALSSSADYINKSFCLIMGSDAFANFMTTWYQWEKILDLAHLIVADREKITPILDNDTELNNLVKHRQIFSPEQLNTQKSGNIMLLNIQPLPISSTLIRSLLKDKKYDEAKKLLPKPVFQYILENNLYN